MVMNVNRRAGTAVAEIRFLPSLGCENPLKRYFHISVISIRRARNDVVSAAALEAYPGMVIFYVTTNRIPGKFVKIFLKGWSPLKRRCFNIRRVLYGNFCYFGYPTPDPLISAIFKPLPLVSQKISFERRNEI